MSPVELHVAEPTGKRQEVQCEEVGASLSGAILELGEERAKCVRVETTATRQLERSEVLRITVPVCGPMLRSQHDLPPAGCCGSGGGTAAQ